MSTTHGHASGLRAGDEIAVTLELDLEPRGAVTSN
jgi:hypothetical protein